jgi:uncharacterized membrane protein YsdA (DUF1294 family)
MSDRSTRAGHILRSLIVAAALLGLAALAWSLAGMAIDRERSLAAGEMNLRNLYPFWGASSLLWAALSGIWILLARSTPGNAKSSNRTALMIIAVAVSARVVVLAYHDPALSDDVNRYIFDGRNLASGHNPYLVIPAERLTTQQERWPGEQQLLPLVTYPELATPYLPVSELVFGGIGLFIGERWSDPLSSARVFRITFVAIEIILMLLMLAALRRSERSAWWLALYAWHPLPITEFAGSGHQDIIGMVLLVGSLLAFTLAPGKTARWSALLALSAMGKPFTLPAGAMMLRGRPVREWIVSLATGAAVGLLALAPFWLIWGDHGAAYHHWRATADVLAEKFAHFGGVYEATLGVVRDVMPAEGQPAGYNLKQEWLARKICAGMLAIIAAGIFASRMNAWQAVRAFLFALVLLTPMAHPWYLLWAFALFPMAPSAALWVASLTIPIGYIVFADGVNWKVPAWALAAAYIPVFAALAADVMWSWRRRQAVTRTAALHPG